MRILAHAQCADARPDLEALVWVPGHPAEALTPDTVCLVLLDGDAVALRPLEVGHLNIGASPLGEPWPLWLQRLPVQVLADMALEASSQAKVAA